jgi:DNA-binding response OmpR family regulator
MPDEPQDAAQNLRVLLVEDNPAVAATLRLFIERSGMQTAWAPTVGRAIELKASFRPDVALVDLELPDADGMVLIEWLAGLRDCGIIVVSGQGDEAQRIVGLETGADDYIAKPPQLRELVARIRAVHRRASQRWVVQAEPPPRRRRRRCRSGRGASTCNAARSASPTDRRWRSAPPSSSCCRNCCSRAARPCGASG